MQGVAPEAAALERRERIGLFSGLFLLVASIVVLAGWATQNQGLVTLGTYWTPTVIGAALCVGGAGVGILGFERHSPSVRNAAGLFIVLICLGHGAETLFDIGPIFDVPALHRAFQPGAMHPGRMVFNTLWGLGLLGVALMLSATSSRLADATRVVSLVAVFFGLTGIVGHFLRLEYLYAWGTATRMAPASAIGIVLAGLTIFYLQKPLLKLRPGREAISEVRQITRAERLTLVVTVSAGCFFALAIMLYLIESMTFDSLQRIAEDRRATVEEIIMGHAHESSLMVQRPDIADAVDRLSHAPGDIAAERNLRLAIQSFLDRGYLAVTVMPTGQHVLSYGRPLHPGATFVPLASPVGATLLWQDGYVLRTEYDLTDANGTVGHIRFDQRLSALDALDRSTRSWGDTGDMVICKIAAPEILCFPNRSYPSPYDRPHIDQNRVLPIVRAIHGEAGVADYRDSRGHDVLAGFGPVGATGLGLSMKMDRNELFAPARHQIEWTLPVLALLLLAGFILLRRSARPLLRRLSHARSTAEASHARFVAAAEGSLDSVALFDSVRDRLDRIVDFRYTYVNANAARFLNTSAAAIYGRSYSSWQDARFPDKFIEIFRKVVETGTPVAGDFETKNPLGGSIWISIQVVRLKDGIAVTARDITEQRNRETALKLAHERLQLALDASGVSLFDWELVGGTVYHSLRWSEMRGGPSVDTRSSPGELFSIVHPAELRSVRKKLVATLKGRVPEFDSEHRVRTLSGDWLWVRSRGRVVERDAQGRAVRLAGTQADISERKHTEQQLRDLALHDPLTSLPNRRVFVDRVAQALNRGRQRRSGTGVLFIDLDHFKRINDTFGHASGDVVLRAFGGLLERCVRPTDTVARLSGDEFTILLEDLEAEDGARVVADKIIDELSNPIDLTGRRVFVTASIGIAYSADGMMSVPELLKRADEAMYRTKRAMRAEPSLGRRGRPV